MRDDTALLHRLLPEVREVAREAGDLALRYFRPGLATSAQIWSKAGGSPVTEADLAVDSFLKERLGGLLPDAAWLSEETADDHSRLGRDLVWIVDPIDGTRAYLSGSRDWSIAIALLRTERPVLGIVHAPAHDTLFEAIAGSGARRDGAPISVSATVQLGSCSVAGPVFMLDRLARTHPDTRRPPRVPSLALRIARVAEGAVDAGLISGNARDWDIAAADLVLAEAGGSLAGLDGAAPRYNQPDPCHGELIAAPAALQSGLARAIRTG
ncbi:3'(2'),5'-bisphosphate nucleotidase CysQ [Enterovirga sp.]|uniref:3'(2'),5'-bisphosphate nucleotidase CysQ n=1 Tax=Enterovirga sp. TaxID=2026350 RepID=UPI00261A3A20|nr:3'(2'),5'-bisphosphate nucleotidase CysQ [Enterovirga sp.]MDB5592605.1 Inositol monophosphatase [Enterovirga sp.]